MGCSLPPSSPPPSLSLPTPSQPPSPVSLCLPPSLFTHSQPTPSLSTPSRSSACSPRLQVRWSFQRLRPANHEALEWTEDYRGLTARQLAAGLLALLRQGTAQEGGASGLHLPQLYPRYWKLPGYGRARALEGTEVSGAIGFEILGFPVARLRVEWRTACCC